MAGFGREALFAVDAFQKPKSLSLRDTVAQMIINVLFMRPGNLPGLPHIGIDIEQYMYRLDGDFDPEEIKQKIYSQCSELMSFISIGEVRIFITKFNDQDTLIVMIPIGGIEEGVSLLIGIKQEDSSDFSYVAQFQEAVKNI